MELPFLNTWEKGDSIVNTANSVISGQLSKKSLKSLMGWGGVMIWDRNIDPVDMLYAYLMRVASESCGECTPCRLGTVRLCMVMERIVGGKGRKSDLKLIKNLVSHISATGKCDIGRTISKPVLDILDAYEETFIEVIEKKRQVKKGEYAHVITAPCINACPSHLDIPGYIENIRMGNWEKAMEIVRKDCPMPGTIGRVCVRPCESACRRGLLDEPISIRALKRFLADCEMNGVIKTESPPQGVQKQKVAVIGAGPAGISCAYYLARRGYPCTIFEAQEGPGGMAAYGIPSYRLPRNVIAHEVNVLEKLGVEIRYGVNVGKDITMEEIASRGYESVFVGVGAPDSSKMRCEGEDAGYRCFLTGVHFLSESARGRKPAEGKKLVVIGGGNVAMDCVRTARRLGFEDVNLLYRRTEAEMPADPQEIREAKEEGIKFHHLVAPVEILAENDTVAGIKCLRMELGEPDSSGRRRPVPVEGSEFVIECDVIIPAIGQVCVVDCVLPEEDVLTSWKTLIVDQTTFQSDRQQIFGGGDCVTGPQTLIGALAAGKNAARFISQYLQQGGCKPELSDLILSLASAEGVYDPGESFPYPGITEREEPSVLEPEIRVNGFDEVESCLTPSRARVESDRCLRCYRLLMSAI
ncbi:MAG: FAD-dependent oxidoreductase [Deltaproteobacteria bacterium]|nr:FAD-dependent oxidoreductase [Deltaproteobacteria bacterium]